jgi:hypothetical protein
MITDNEWNHIAKKTFPASRVKAPPFLWTRILAAIQAEETRRASTWWMQWRWMSRVTIAVGLLVTLGTFYLLHNSAMPLDQALSGQSNQQHALELASTNMTTPDDAVVLVLGLDS